jgi:replication-associated recombination protein RarA
LEKILLLTPLVLGDDYHITYPDDATQQLVLDLVNGYIPLPIREGKCGILIYGVPGTGKSALARLLPDAIESARGGSVANEFFASIQPDANGVKLIQSIASCASTVPFAKYHYFVLDEVDCLNKSAMSTLKSVMNYPHTLWIMTTNNIKDIENGVKDRCYCIPFNAAPPDRWLPLAHRILTLNRISGIPDQNLISIISHCAGSARNIFAAITELCIRVQRTSKATNSFSMTV